MSAHSPKGLTHHQLVLCIMLVKLVSVALVTCHAVLSAAMQQPFSSFPEQNPDRSPSYPFSDTPRIEVSESSSRQSIQDLVASYKGQYVTLSHADFPQASIRIRKVSSITKSVSQMSEAPNASPLLSAYNASDPTAFCDPTVNSWSGYVDTIDGKSLFFYFFESRSNPDKDPVLMWLTGGPGCSSSLGLFMELGPCLVPENGGIVREGPPINGTVWNPYSWNNKANVFFLDQPVDVGYSYSRYGLHTYDSDTGAKDVYVFLRIFFGAFTKFQKNDFVITGESYAGRYIPRYASEIVDQNNRLKTNALRNSKPIKKNELINLKKVAIGNGLTDVATQIPSYYDFTCTRRGGSDPVLSIETCKRLVTWKARCEKWITKECRSTYDADQCVLALNACEGEMSDAYMETKRNPYNVRDLCKVGLEPNLCYQVTADIRAYLNRPDVRQLVGAEPVSKIGNFTSCNNDVGQGFSRHNDVAVAGSDYVAGLLERNISVLIYVGKLDWICNWLGNKAWVDKLDWTDAHAFHSDNIQPWLVDGKNAGMTRQGGGLTWATIEGAGHMVPYDKPLVALEMLNRFLDGDKL